MDVDGPVGEEPLDRLVCADRTSKLRPRLGVRDGRLQEAVRGADRARRETTAAVIERGESDREPFAVFTETLGRWNAHLAEIELRGRRPVESHLRVVAADLETAGRALDGECRDPLRPELRIERREDDEHVGDRRIRDEGLRTVDDIRVAVAARDRLEAAGVASRAGLGESVRADLPRRQQIRQVAFAKRVRSADVDGGAAQTRGSTDDVPERCIRAGELLDGDAVTELAKPLAAHVLAETETEEAHAGHRVDHRTRYLVLLLDLSLERREPLLDELADRALEHDEVDRKSTRLNSSHSQISYA